MINWLKILMMFIALTLPFSSYAKSDDFDFSDLLDAITKIYGVNLDMKDLNGEQLDKLNELSEALKGTHTYGNNYYNVADHDWGSNATDWQSILSMTRHGHGDGELGDVISTLSRDFPMENSLNSPNDIENKYYELSAQDALASRSSSEVAYKQAVRAEKTMNTLHDLIDKTPDSKSAEDLNNRFAAESTMSSIQQTKLLAILIQQISLQSQAESNRAKEDKEFFEAK